MTSLTVRLNPRHVFAGYACWQRFSKRDHHPIAAHFRRRLPRRQTVSAPALAVGSGIIILFAMAFAFHSIAEALVWTIPCGSCCTVSSAAPPGFIASSP